MPAGGRRSKQSPRFFTIDGTRLRGPPGRGAGVNTGPVLPVGAPLPAAPSRWLAFRRGCIFTATGPASGRRSPPEAGSGEEPRSWGRSRSRREFRVLRHSSLSRRRCVPLASPARTHKKPAGWRVSRGAPDPTLPAGSGPGIPFLSTFRIPWTPGRFWRRPPGSGCLLTRQTGRPQNPRYSWIPVGCPES